jgi:hypothetical protein
MLDLLVHWFVSTGSLLIVAFLFPGIEVAGLGSALLAPIVIGFINATIGLVVKILTLPLTILTLGHFLAGHQRINAPVSRRSGPRFLHRWFFFGVFRSHRAEHREHAAALSRLVSC